MNDEWHIRLHKLEKEVGFSQASPSRRIKSNRKVVSRKPPNANWIINIKYNATKQCEFIDRISSLQLFRDPFRTYTQQVCSSYKFPTN